MIFLVATVKFMVGIKSGTAVIGKETCVRQSFLGIVWDFVVLKVEEEGKTVLWVAKVLLLFRLSATRHGDIQEFAYVQYMEDTGAITGVGLLTACASGGLQQTNWTEL